MSQNPRTRRDVFDVAGALVGAAAFAAAATPAAARAQAAASSELEKANLELVNAFCDAWSTQDHAKIMGFFAEKPAYRQTELVEPAIGRQAVSDKIAGFVNNVVKFEIHESWARGPMVINERHDYFTGARIQWWHGVGVFLVKDAKIVEWYDYTIELRRT